MRAPSAASAPRPSRCASIARIRISTMPANSSVKPDQHDRQRPQDRRIDRRSGQPDARPLVQRVPPHHRIADDRQQHRAGDAEDRRHAPVAAAIRIGARERHVAEIDEEQQQHRRQPPVPLPPRPPGRPPPDRAGHQADRREHRARQRDRARGDRGQRMPPDEIARCSTSRSRSTRPCRARRRGRGCRGCAPSRPADSRAASASAPPSSRRDQRRRRARTAPASAAGRSSGSARDWRGRGASARCLIGDQAVLRGRHPAASGRRWAS